DGRKGDLHRRIASQDLSGQPTVLVNVRAGTNAGVVCAKIEQGARHIGKQSLDPNTTKRLHFDSHPVIRGESAHGRNARSSGRRADGKTMGGKTVG
ncbi:unnamed protein product, partial [Ixodes pacificus]